MLRSVRAQARHLILLATIFTAVVLTVSLSACGGSDDEQGLRPVQKAPFSLVFRGLSGSGTHLYAATSGSWAIRQFPAAFDGIICPAWSPSFKHVADNRTGAVMRADGSNRRQFNFPFTWSPDGGEFAYSDVDSGTIVVVVVDGSESRTVADGFLPTWAPDGLIYYDHDTNLDTATKGVDPDTGDVETFPGDGWFVYGKWSPDGRRVAYTRSFDEEGIFVSEMGEFDHPEMLGDDLVDAFAWSPDGERLAVVAGRRDPSAPPPNAGGFVGVRWELHVVRVTGGSPDRVAEVDANELTWSPDGEWIALQRAYGYSDSGAPASDLWVVHPDGTGLRRVTHGERSATSNNCASWVPDEVVNEALTD